MSLFLLDGSLYDYGTKIRNMLHSPGIHVVFEKEKWISCKKCNQKCSMGVKADIRNPLRCFLITFTLWCKSLYPHLALGVLEVGDFLDSVKSVGKTGGLLDADGEVGCLCIFDK